MPVAVGRRSVALCGRIGTFLRAVLALSFLSGGAVATWSIVCVDMQTGEVCVASATCVPSANLMMWVPLIQVGNGAGGRGGRVSPPCGGYRPQSGRRYSSPCRSNAALSAAPGGVS